MKIVVAEDQPPTALFLRRTLEKLGHEVELAPDGEAAWDALRAGEARVVISDWMMPHLDGPALCRRIRAAGDDPYIYAILLTSRGGHDDRLEGLNAGADDFLTKPTDLAELAVRLKIAGRILAVHERLSAQNARLTELAMTDPLTGVKNRRCFFEELEGHLGHARRSSASLSLMMLDVDHFKAYNDAFGHPAGDEALRLVGSTLGSVVRGHDVVARYGGEEFALLLPATGPAEALEVAVRLRLSLAAQVWPHRPVTASIGVAAEGPSGDYRAADLIRRADEALYRSKRDGRDRITLHSRPDDDHAGATRAGDAGRRPDPSIGAPPHSGERP